MLPYTANCHDESHTFPTQPERSPEEHLMKCLIEAAEIKHPFDRELRNELRYLSGLVAGCNYYVRRNILTSGLTDISIDRNFSFHFEGAQYPRLGSDTLHPGNAMSVPYLLQPPWLRENEWDVEFRGSEDCCPGHCWAPNCAKYCFDAMFEFIDRLSSPYTHLTVEQLADIFQSDPRDPKTPFNVHIDGPKKMADLMLQRVRGPLRDYSNPIARLAMFCHCSSAVMQGERCRAFDNVDLEGVWQTIQYTQLETGHGGLRD